MKCSNCMHWEYESDNKGTCTRINEFSGSDLRADLDTFGAILSDPGVLWTDKDFGCSLFRILA